MSIPYAIFPDLAPNQTFNLPPVGGPAPTVPGAVRLLRGQGWNVKESCEYKNNRQQATNGRVYVTKYWPNPLWSWEFIYGTASGYLKDAPLDVIPANAPWTDKEILSGFFNGMQGGGSQFAYQPPDYFVNNQILPYNAANNYEIVHAIGAYPSPDSVFISTPQSVAYISEVAITSNVLTLTFYAPILPRLPFVAGMEVVLEGLTTATFLNGETVTLLTVVPGGTMFTATANFTHGNYATTSDTGWALYSSLYTPVTESVQLLDSTYLTAEVNGTGAGYTLNNPSTVTGFQGYVINFSTPPTSGDLITVSFPFYYICRFAEDTQDYENFSAMLWGCSSVKIAQDRI